jgi:hypothetical protein
MPHSNRSRVSPVARCRPTSTISVPLFDDGSHDDGAMEPDGIYNHQLSDLTRVEGTYEFRAVATFGEGCLARREAFWSIHVEPGIDPDRSDVNVIDIADHPDGRHGTLVLVPRDRYGNPLGPGRGDRFTVAPMPGVRVDRNVKDRRDGSWGGCRMGRLGYAHAWCLVQQPDRDPVIMPPATGVPPVLNATAPIQPKNCSDCLGFHDPDEGAADQERVARGGSQGVEARQGLRLLGQCHRK